MKIAIVGHGKMGREVEAVLRERGNEAVVRARDAPFPQDCAVGIDFTRAEAVPANVAAALEAGARYVVGTTGWHDQMHEVRWLVEKRKGGLIHAANFSLGVNLFYRVVRAAATMLAPFPEYDPYVLERHHRQKKDAPSGTASVLAQLLASSGGQRHDIATSLKDGLPEWAFHVASVRAGGIVGEHTVGFDSGNDEILLEHRARSRRGFAIGAVLAAEWIATRTGFFDFAEVIDSLSRA